MKGTRKNHDFCWINLMTPELVPAAGFFQRVFGWQFADGIPGGYVIQVNGLGAGALMDIETCPPGYPPSIGVMVKVENAEATVARVNALGGRAESAFDVRGNGRMATCTDPNGGVFNVWQPLAKDGAECDTLAHGAPTWFETQTTDLDRAVEFYADLFGWTPRTEHPAPGMTYTVFHLGDAPIAGAMALFPDKLGEVPSHWGTYFTVANADETVRLATSLGASLCVPPHDIPNVGRFALMKSPQGVAFHILEHAAP
jgi:predicted enzyme related to lactoylglutathione lyase